MRERSCWITRGGSRICRAILKTRWPSCATNRPAGSRSARTNLLRCICWITLRDTAAGIRKIKVQIRRSLSSKIPAELIDGDLELGILDLRSGRRAADLQVIYTDHLAFIVSPGIVWPRARGGVDHGTGRGDIYRPQRGVAVPGAGDSRISAAQGSAQHGSGDARPWRRSAKWCSGIEGVAFLPRMCVEEEVAPGDRVRGAR